MEKFAILMLKMDNSYKKIIIIKNSKIIGKKKNNIILLITKIFKLKVDKVDVQYIFNFKMILITIAM